MPDDRAVEIVRELNASVDVVFRAWTQPAHLCRWFHGTRAKVDSVEIDLCNGGAYRIAFSDNEEVYVVCGVYVRVQPPHLIEFTWRWEASDLQPDETLVHVELEAIGQRTRMHLNHTKFASDALRQEHLTGWETVLAALAEYVSN